MDTDLGFQPFERRPARGSGRIEWDKEPPAPGIGDARHRRDGGGSGLGNDPSNPASAARTDPVSPGRRRALAGEYRRQTKSQAEAGGWAHRPGALVARWQDRALSAPARRYQATERNSRAHPRSEPGQDRWQDQPV